MKRLPWPERLWAKCAPDANGCWVWTAATIKAGYGLVYGPAKKDVLAHRAAYEASVGPIPAGLEIDHLCNVPACINPAHLEPVTPAENIRRRVERQTHCKRGHEFTTRDTIVRAGKVRRRCFACRAARVAEGLTA